MHSPYPTSNAAKSPRPGADCGATRARASQNRRRAPAARGRQPADVRARDGLVAIPAHSSLSPARFSIVRRETPSVHYFSDRMLSKSFHQLSHLSQRSALPNRIGVARGAHLAQQAVAPTDAAHERDPEVDLRGRKLSAVASRRETGLGAHRGAKLKARPWEQETETQTRTQQLPSKRRTRPALAALGYSSRASCTRWDVPL